MKNANIDVYGDVQWFRDSEGNLQSTDVSVPWPLSELKKWIEDEHKLSTDSGELEDLQNALIEVAFAETAMTQGNALSAVYSGIEIGKYLARHEVRPRRRGNAKGGKATKKLSPDQEKLALELIAEKQTVGVSKTAACTRAASDLSKHHKINVSKETLLNLLRAQQ